MTDNNDTKFCGCKVSTTHYRVGEYPNVTVICIECGGIVR